MCGWDWGACLPDGGIFRPVTLLGIETARLDSVYIRQVHKDGKVLLVPEVDVETVDEEESEADGYEGAQALEYQVTVTAPNGTKTIWDDCPDEMEIENPQLWWPNGLGEQPLYQVQVDLKAGDKIVDTWCRKIGLRALTMHREKDQWGESFAHEVNGYQSLPWALTISLRTIFCREHPENVPENYFFSARERTLIQYVSGAAAIILRTGSLISVMNWG